MERERDDLCRAASLGTGGHHLCAGAILLGALSLAYVEPCTFLHGLYVGVHTAGRDVCSPGCANLHASSSDDHWPVRVLLFPIYRSLRLGRQSLLASNDGVGAIVCCGYHCHVHTSLQPVLVLSVLTASVPAAEGTLVSQMRRRGYLIFLSSCFLTIVS